MGMTLLLPTHRIHTIALALTGAILLAGCGTAAPKRSAQDPGIAITPLPVGYTGCFKSSYCTNGSCLDPSDPTSQVLCGCKIANAACGPGSCVGTSYLEGNACANPIVYASSSPVSQLMCGGNVAQPSVGMQAAKVMSDSDPVGAYTANYAANNRGSNRGSGYTQSNPILRHCDKLFVTWQGYEPTGDRKVWVRMNQTNSQGVSTWSPAVALTDPNSSTIQYPSGYSYVVPPYATNGMDDHGMASLIADRAGFLHLFYGAHTSAMLEAVSSSPWTTTFAAPPTVVPTAPWYRTTYSSVVRDSSDGFHVVYRGVNSNVVSTDCSPTSGPGVWELVYQRRSGGVWSMGQPLATAHTNCYTYYGAAMAIGADGSLHVAYTLYSDLWNVAPAWGYMHLAVGGNTWTGPQGTALNLPVDTSNAAALVEGAPFNPSGSNLDVRVNNIAVDPAGNPWVSVLYLANGKVVDTKLQHRLANGSWAAIPLSTYVSPFGPSWRVSGASITFDAQGVLYVAAERVDQNDNATYAWFDGPTKEVVLLVSPTPNQFATTVWMYPAVSYPITNLRPHYLANIERPTTPDPIPVPALLYTDGSSNHPASGSGFQASDIIFVPFYKH